MKKPTKVYVLKDFEGYLLVANEFRGKPALRSLYVMLDPRLAKKTVVAAPVNVSNKQSIQTEYPETAEALRSNNPFTMREAAIKVGKEKLYQDDAIFLTLISVLENAVANVASGADNNKHLIDGLSWCAINLGKSGDKRATLVLEQVSESALSKKVKKHALAALKRLNKG